MQITRGPIQSAQRVVIYGPEGIGKSTLASKFPNPLFIDTEGSTKQLDVARTPAPSSWAMLMGQVDYVVANPTTCNTLVIDTADWAERMAARAICDKSGKDGIEDFGYGKGYVYLAEEFGKLLNRLGDVITKGVNVVFTAHAQMRKFEQPGEAGSYDRWELKLERKTAPMLKEWADMVLFANYKTIVVNVDGQGVGKGRNIAEGGKRVMYTTHHPAWDAKNRHGLPAEIPMDYAAIAHCFSAPPSVAAPSAPPPPPAPEPPPAPVAAAEDKPEEPVPTTAAPPPSAPDPKPAPELPSAAPEDDLEAAGVPKALADLMRANHVTLGEIQAVVAHRGYFPADTPFANYPPDFVEGVLIGAWDQVHGVIQSMRDEAPF